MSNSDLTQAQVFDQVEEKGQEAFSKKPKNLDDMIQLYMEMLINHRMMEARLQKIESRMNLLCSLLTKNQGAQI